MAILDASNNAVVIRVVYDGAPFAGKTTSVGALGRGLGAAVHSPAEINGRTLYFDWLDYTGGLFEGHRIRCQIVSAPGQASLASRRRRLLESADEFMPGRVWWRYYGLELPAPVLDAVYRGTAKKVIP